MMHTHDSFSTSATQGNVTLVRPSVYRGMMSVFAYEFKRSLTPFRIAVWCAMALFPIFLTTMVSYVIQHANMEAEDNRIGFTMLMFALLPEVITILGMLLWATPIVNAELEGLTWIYSVIRPGARRAMLLGKYLMAVLWTSSCTCAAATISIPITQMDRPFLAWGTICALCVVSSLAHGALFVFIGTFLQRRAMVSAFAYAIAIEGILSWIPATINKLTIGYRLRSLLIEWLDLPLERMGETSRLVSDGTPVWVHLCTLGVGVVVVLALSVWRIQTSQFSVQSEL